MSWTPRWSEQLPDLLEFTGDDILVAHNAGFDMGVIKAACAASVLAVPSYSYCLQPAGCPQGLHARLVPAPGGRDGRRVRGLPPPRRRRGCRGVRRDHDPRGRPCGAIDLAELAAACGRADLDDRQPVRRRGRELIRSAASFWWYRAIDRSPEASRTLRIRLFASASLAAILLLAGCSATVPQPRPEPTRERRSPLATSETVEAQRPRCS